MVLNDTLANALSKILNAERSGKNECTIKPMSKVIIKILTMLQDRHYVGEVSQVDDGRGGYVVVNLIGALNGCGAIKPRFSVKKAEYEKWEKRYLPAKDFGVIIVSTPKGMLTHNDAKRQQLGGRLIAYCY